ncbi:hypothetical protein [Pseudomonas syringae]|uniref:hypothetical protein n=2 Tax=Pseudomonas syringae TaxID=317 RepID=UPI001F47DBB5|nr:hypothetical protein [Pseudomonas syringae]MCF5371297.1 hypothetical protein [Pseudomonas syringae]MCF5382106.1 hypothetical protein [Pseudomonas syringae]MCF5422935.1 hypothetical protein [Pseudomonas syringae]MCF5460190.1 hypothetical protein [Pseudomonas syringae]
MKLSCIVLMLALGVGGCSTQPGATLPDQTQTQREIQILNASHAVNSGSFDKAEKLMGDYLFRDGAGELRFKSLNVSSEVEKQAVDTVALLLWDTKRDATLISFSNRYLSGYEREVMLCRVAERGADYEKAYNCWNDLGDVDRARRTIKTESALRVLKD